MGGGARRRGGGVGRVLAGAAGCLAVGRRPGTLPEHGAARVRWLVDPVGAARGHGLLSAEGDLPVGRMATLRGIHRGLPCRLGLPSRAGRPPALAASVALFYSLRGTGRPPLRRAPGGRGIRRLDVRAEKRTLLGPGALGLLSVRGVFKGGVVASLRLGHGALLRGAALQEHGRDPARLPRASCPLYQGTVGAAQPVAPPAVAPLVPGTGSGDGLFPGAPRHRGERPHARALGAALAGRLEPSALPARRRPSPLAGARLCAGAGKPPGCPPVGRGARGGGRPCRQVANLGASGPPGPLMDIPPSCAGLRGGCPVVPEGRPQGRPPGVPEPPGGLRSGLRRRGPGNWKGPVPGAINPCGGCRPRGDRGAGSGRARAGRALSLPEGALDLGRRAQSGRMACP